jgi:dTMP kinase
VSERAASDAHRLRGRFVTFEGIEGSGKTTQIERLAQRLTAAGADVVRTREPGGTALGRELRALLLRPAEQPMSPTAELLLYLTDRAQHLTEVVEPALERGAIVLCDRFTDATLAYQGYGRGLGVERIEALHRHAPLDRTPDRTLLFELDVGVALRRATRRNEIQELAATEGRFEQEQLDFHRRVAGGYRALAAAEPGRFRVIDAAGGVEQVERRVWEALRDLTSALEDEAC